MSYYFSPSRLAFYSDEFLSEYEAAKTWPSDAMAISDEDHAAYTQLPPKGQMLGADNSGNPAWEPSPELPLTQVKTQQISIITQACAAAITSGFTSSSLGSAHTYPSGLTDQANLAANVLSSLLPGLPSTWATPYPCCDANGVWGSKEHTASQIQQVGADWKAFLSSCLLKKRALEDKIKLAKTVGKVQALAW